MEFFEVIYPWVITMIFSTFFLLFIGVIKVVLVSKINGSLHVSEIEKRILILLLILLISSVLIEEYRAHFIIRNIQVMLTEETVKIITGRNFVLNKAQFIQDFSKIKTVKHSGSSPRESINLLILTSKGTLDLNFKRDSKEKNLYWVYYPKHPFSGSLGYLKTEVFSDL